MKREAVVAVLASEFLSWGSKPKKERREKKYSKKERKTEKKLSQLLVSERKKTEVGDEDGEEVKKNPEEIWPYFFGILLNAFPNQPPMSESAKIICNTKRSTDKQSESVNVRPKRMASTRLATENPRTCPGPEDRSIT